MSSTEDPLSQPTPPETQADPEATGADELEQLSTQELHDRAVSWAEHHLDVKFFWRLLKAIPTAEAITGGRRRAIR